MIGRDAITLRASRRDLAFLILAIALFTVTLTVLEVEVAQREGVIVADWWYYSNAVHRWLIQQAIFTGGRLSTVDTPVGVSYSYPPSSLPFFLPFSQWPIGAIFWTATLISALMTGMWRVVRDGWPDRPIRAMAGSIALLALFIPALEGIAVGNVNVLTAGVLGWIWSNRRIAPGASGVLAAVKVFPLALAAPFGRRSLTTAAVVAAAIVLVTLPFVGTTSWLGYASAVQVTVADCGASGSTGFSIACGLAPLTGPAVASLVGLVVAAVLLLAAAAAGPSLVGITLAVGAIIAPAPELHAHYFTMLFMLALIGAGELSRRRRTLRLLDLHVA